MNEFDINRLVNGKVWPPIGPYPKGVNSGIENAGIFSDAKTIDGFAQDKVEFTQFGTPMAMPLKIKKQSSPESDWWLLPTESLITIGGKNILVKRNVAKSKFRGSIKERWAQDDYSITIQGLFTVKDTYEYPVSDLEKLRAFCEAKEPIEVLCPLFEILGVNRIVIESYDLPHTKGEENQNWTISALSDDDWNLFIEIDNPGKNAL